MATMIPCTNPKLCGVQFHHPGTITRCKAPGSVTGPALAVTGVAMAPSVGSSATTRPPGDAKLEDRADEYYEEKWGDDLEEHAGEELGPDYIVPFLKENDPGAYRLLIDEVAETLRESERVAFQQRNTFGTNTEAARVGGPGKAKGGKPFVMKPDSWKNEREYWEAIPAEYASTVPPITRDRELVGDEEFAGLMKRFYQDKYPEDAKAHGDATPEYIEDFIKSEYLDGYRALSVIIKKNLTPDEADKFQQRHKYGEWYRTVSAPTGARSQDPHRWERGSTGLH